MHLIHMYSAVIMKVGKDKIGEDRIQIYLQQNFICKPKKDI